VTVTARRHAAVLGKPVAHSLSPVLHRAAYASLGLDWDYTAIECAEDDLALVVGERTDWAGFSCTMPLKHAAFELAERRSEAATAVGAANTLLPLDGGAWLADNTDVDGVVNALAEHRVDAAELTILGAGGTAQAVLVAAKRLGSRSCTALVRDVSRAAALRATAERAGVAITIGELGVGAVALHAGLVVSTLPAGAADQFAGQSWRSDQVVLDVTYDPWPSALAASVVSCGATVIGGAQMLLHQAARQVELMTGQQAPLAAMRAALQQALAGR
jgi:shikimate dehydrogenase